MGLKKQSDKEDQKNKKKHNGEKDDPVIKTATKTNRTSSTDSTDSKFGGGKGV